jgi:hypothetical protein
MLVFLMPADVSRNLKMLPVSISAEETQAAFENHRRPGPGGAFLSVDLLGDY